MRPVDLFLVALLERRIMDYFDQKHNVLCLSSNYTNYETHNLTLVLVRL